MLKLLLGDPNARKLKRYQPIVSDINLLEEEIAPLSDDELRAKTKTFQEQLALAVAESAEGLMCKALEGPEAAYQPGKLVRVRVRVSQP